MTQSNHHSSEGGPWQRVSLAHSLDQYPQEWAAEHLEAIQRLVRDPHRRVWEPASEALGRRAHEEGGAAQMLGELLTSSVMEMRLRGLVALGALAEYRPEEVLAFLEQRLEEAAWNPDPVLLEAILTLLPQLSDGRGIELMAGALEDPRDEVRAAAAGALVHWQTWPWASLVRLVTDPSLIVRASMVKVLARFVPSPEAMQALALLAAAPEPPLRELVAAELPRDLAETAYLLGTLQADSNDRVQQAARGPRAEPGPATELPPLGDLLLQPSPGLGAAQELEAQLDQAPERALDIIRGLLGKAGIVPALAQLGEMARSQPNRLLCRALSVLFSSRADEPARRLLRMLGILTEVEGPSPAAQLKRLVWLCVHAHDADSLDKLVWWGDYAAQEPASELTPGAYQAIRRMVNITTALSSGFGMAALAEAGSDLQTLTTDLNRLTQDPEREILQMVLDRWRELFTEGVQEMLVGVSL